MERLELLNLGFNFTMTVHGLNALAQANDMTQALLNPTRVSDVHDMHDDYPTLPAIVLPRLASTRWNPNNPLPASTGCVGT